MRKAMSPASAVPCSVVRVKPVAMKKSLAITCASGSRLACSATMRVLLVTEKSPDPIVTVLGQGIR